MPMLRHVLEMILNPYFLCLLLFSFCLIFLWLGGNKPILRWSLTLVWLAFLFLSTGWLPESLTRYFEDQYPPIAAVNPRIHWVVVLSGGQAEVENKPANALLTLTSLKRLLEGVRLYRELPNANLVLSGGGYFQVPEALRLSEIASWLAIPKEKLLIEPYSLNTANQASAIKAIVKQEPFYLVTSAIHMQRSLALCHAQGLKPIAAPTDFTYFWNEGRLRKTLLPNPYNLCYLSIAYHELLGQLWNKLHHRWAKAQPTM